MKFGKAMLATILSIIFLFTTMASVSAYSYYYSAYSPKIHSYRPYYYGSMVTQPAYFMAGAYMPAVYYYNYYPIHTYTYRYYPTYNSYNYYAGYYPRYYSNYRYGYWW